MSSQESLQSSSSEAHLANVCRDLFPCSPKPLVSRPPQSPRSDVIDSPRTPLSDVFDPPRTPLRDVFDPPRSPLSDVFDPPRSPLSDVEEVAPAAEGGVSSPPMEYMEPPTYRMSGLQLQQTLGAAETNIDACLDAARQWRAKMSGGTQDAARVLRQVEDYILNTTIAAARVTCMMAARHLPQSYMVVADLAIDTAKDTRRSYYVLRQEVIPFLPASSAGTKKQRLA